MSSLSTCPFCVMRCQNWAVPPKKVDGFSAEMANEFWPQILLALFGRFAVTQDLFLFLMVDRLFLLYLKNPYGCLPVLLLIIMYNLKHLVFVDLFPILRTKPCQIAPRAAESGGCIEGINFVGEVELFVDLVEILLPRDD